MLQPSTSTPNSNPYLTVVNSGCKTSTVVRQITLILGNAFMQSMPYDSRHVAAAFFAGLAAAYTIHEIFKSISGVESSRSRYMTRHLSILFTDKEVEAVFPSESIGKGIESTIGNTPLILLKSLSQATGCTILAKCEFLNGAGGSPKDRVALSIIETAEDAGLLTPHSGDTIYEGTVGSTGISLATLARARGYKAHICMPDDQAHEKPDLLLRLGAIVDRVTPAPIVDQRHFVNRARNLAREHATDPDKAGRGLFADQFETTANWRAHFEGTGPEIYDQAGGRIDAFVAGAGTGGTISGVAKYLRSKLRSIKIVLADPQGSGLYNKIHHGVMFHGLEREGTRRRQQVDTVVEGIGLTRSTSNFEAGADLIDDAIKVTDDQARAMARWLCEKDGIFVGSSSAVNCFAACKVAMNLGPGNRVVTILCDSGMRHLSKFWKQVGEVGGDHDIDFNELMST